MWKKKPSVKDLLPPPVRVSHGEYSMILSLHDDPAQANEALIDLSLRAIAAAYQINLTDVCKRLHRPPYFPNIWPGEHYKLLAGFVQVIKPKIAIEIGTSTGISALSMIPYLPEGGKLVTFDIRPWNSYPDTVLKESDFKNAPLKQIIADLSDPDVFEQHRALIRQAEWIFIDATHDGDLEKRILDLLAAVNYERPPFLLFDDIRVWTMLKMWREIHFPKLDLTSFGHWSGTGLVQIN